MTNRTVRVLAGSLLTCFFAVGCGPQRVSQDIAVAPAAVADPLAEQFSHNPIAVLEQGLKWYDGYVKDYTCTLYKLERIDPAAKDFLPEQKLECKFKENPFSVFTHTVVNPRGATKALYVEGQWDGKMKGWTGGLLPLTLSVEPRGAMARLNTLRFIDQFGFKRSLLAVTDAFRTARGEGIQQLKVIGLAKVGDRDVLVIESWITEKPAAERAAASQPGQPPVARRFEFPHSRVYLDRQWKIPLGVDIWDVNDSKRGEYRLTDIKFNVGLTDADFTLKANGM